MTGERHLSPVQHKSENECEMCGTPIVGGHYELSIVRESGQNVLWLLDKIACVRDFAIRYTNLDYALENGEEENEE